MRTTDLDYIFESLGLRIEGIPQFSQGRNEVLADLKNGSNMHDGWESIVRALAHVNMVIWMDWLLRAELATEDLNCPIRNDLANS